MDEIYQAADEREKIMLNARIENINTALAEYKKKYP